MHKLAKNFIFFQVQLSAWKKWIPSFGDSSMLENKNKRSSKIVERLIAIYTREFVELERTPGDYQLR